MLIIHITVDSIMASILTPPRGFADTMSFITTLRVGIKIKVMADTLLSCG